MGQAAPRANGFIETRELSRYYRRGPHEVRALDGVDLAIERGTCVGLIGASGSGKSTLLNLLGGLDTPTAGAVSVDGVELGALDRRQLAHFRARQVGMVFQAFNLLPQYDALRNVELALVMNGTPVELRRARATGMLERLGLGDRLDHRPADLSGGEQQRVAIARALVKEPDILLADEPTGNLDHGSTEQIVEVLGGLRERGLTIILATHDLEVARRVCQRTVELHYGRLRNGGGTAHP
ncbi:MAG: ABC transporter ATP-binding protein [Candidatus Eiseniibacteriota bacterium]|jgi:predicted ABC-type transport system involved in lysophospholipase L1 biosynthesis ATPase subunit